MLPGCLLKFLLQGLKFAPGGVNGLPAGALFVKGACYRGLSGAAGDTELLFF